MIELAANAFKTGLPDWLNAEHVLQALGPYMLVGVALLIFADCGILIGFLIPGDTLLFTGGLLMAEGVIATPLWLSCVILSICAVLGNFVGYYVGKAVGPRLFNKPDSRFFKREYVDRTHAFFERYGTGAIILGRFVPIVRTFITAIAGIAGMDRRKYFTYSFVGGVLWATGVTLLGYFLGQVPFVHQHFEIFLVAIPVISVIPIAVEYVKMRNERRAAARGEGVARES